MRVVVLASGSKGNCTYIETKDAKILIDLGISMKRLKNQLEEIGVDVKDINALFLTHEHIDHACGVANFCKKYQKPIYLSEGTAKGLNPFIESYLENTVIISSGNSIELNDLKITPIDIHHDALEPLGFILHHENKKIVYITDTGYVDLANYALMQNADLFILESNHDPEILWSSSRPFMLKKRIIGDRGHLSNEDSAICIAHTMGPNTKYVIHAHISEECNLFEIVAHTYKKILNDYGIICTHTKFVCALQYQMTGIFEL